MAYDLISEISLMAGLKEPGQSEGRMEEQVQESGMPTEQEQANSLLEGLEVPDAPELPDYGHKVGESSTQINAIYGLTQEIMNIKGRISWSLMRDGKAVARGTSTSFEAAQLAADAAEKRWLDANKESTDAYGAYDDLPEGKASLDNDGEYINDKQVVSKDDLMRVNMLLHKGLGESQLEELWDELHECVVDPADESFAMDVLSVLSEKLTEAKVMARTIGGKRVQVRNPSSESDKRKRRQKYRSMSKGKKAARSRMAKKRLRTGRARRLADRSARLREGDTLESEMAESRGEALGHDDIQGFYDE